MVLQKIPTFHDQQLGQIITNSDTFWHRKYLSVTYTNNFSHHLSFSVLLTSTLFCSYITTYEIMQFNVTAVFSDAQQRRESIDKKSLDLEWIEM